MVQPAAAKPAAAVAAADESSAAEPASTVASTCGRAARACLHLFDASGAPAAAAFTAASKPTTAAQPATSLSGARDGWMRARLQTHKH
jgi:hypothetical protein